MPSVLNLKPEEVDTNEKRSKYTASIIGCGQKGALYAVSFAEFGFKVICIDDDPTVLKKVAKGKIPNLESQIEMKLKSHINLGQISVSNDHKKAISQSDLIIITIGVKVDEQKKIDYTQIIGACKQIGAALHQGMLVIYAGVVGMGFIEGTLREALENTSGLKKGQDFGLAYTPILSGDSALTNLDLKVSAADKTSLAAASIILKTITKKVVEIKELKTEEIATLFNVAKQDLNRALANELAVFCEKANIDYFKVLKLLDANDRSCWPTIVENENREEAYLLLDSAENLNAKLRLPALARHINEDMVSHAVNLMQSALRGHGKPLRRAKIAILSTANPTVAGLFAKMLEIKGAKVSLYDPMSKIGSQEWRNIETNLNEVIEGTDCIVILSGQQQFRKLNLKKLKALMKTPSILVDLIGIFEPKNVEAEGFIYYGLGRGSEKN